MQLVQQRLSHLDGLRGIAAVIVAAFHFLRAFNPHFLATDSWLQRSPLSVLWNGHFAVEVFFALSGYLFLAKYYGSEFDAAAKAAAKRYFRLTVPLVGASLAAWLMHKAGFFSAAQTAADLSGSDWLARWYRFPPDLGLALYEPIVGMYMNFDATRSYNSNLWTISYELYAVWLVITIAVAGRFLKPPAMMMVLAAIGVAFAFTYVFAFIIGAAVALLDRRRNRADLSLPATAFLAVTALGAASFWPLIAVDSSARTFLIWPVAAGTLIFAIGNNATLREVFARPAMLRIGRLSFGVYICHFLTINSAAAWTFVASGSVFATLAVYFGATALAALAFESCLDRPSSRALDKLFGAFSIRRQLKAG